jgi:hypothetical protein
MRRRAADQVRSTTPKRRAHVRRTRRTESKLRNAVIATTSREAGRTVGTRAGIRIAVGADRKRDDESESRRADCVASDTTEVDYAHLTSRSSSDGQGDVASTCYDVVVGRGLRNSLNVCRIFGFVAFGCVACGGNVEPEPPHPSTNRYERGGIECRPGGACLMRVVLSSSCLGVYATNEHGVAEAVPREACDAALNAARTAVAANALSSTSACASEAWIEVALPDASNRRGVIGSCATQAAQDLANKMDAVASILKTKL